jgi:MinD superfamily P-loop ATPase
MRQIVVLSGKGGTGKTTVAAALAHQFAQDGSAVIVDADVDAPNLGLLLQPQVREQVAFSGARKAAIDGQRCTGCGRCEEVCRFGALCHRDGSFWVDAVACEGCASCHYQCPVKAIDMREVHSGEWYRSETRFGAFLHGHLRPGEENSGKLVSVVRSQALVVAREHGADWVLIDGPPGIGCPVIAAVTGADLAVLVTEPTVSGLHDLDRVVGLCEHFGIRCVACLNKCDISPGLGEQVRRFCARREIPLVAEVPYDELVVAAMRMGRAVTELDGHPVATELRRLWREVRAVWP